MANPVAAKVRDTVRYNTRGSKPDTILEQDLRTVLVERGRLSDDEFDAGLEKALTKGWVERTEAGRLRMPE